MKRLILSSFLLSCLLASNAYAGGKRKGTNELYQKGQVNLKIGVGVVPVYSLSTPDYALFGEVTQTKGLLMGARLEYAISDNLGIGFNASQSTSSKLTITDVTNENNKYGFDNSSLIIGLHATYHLKTNGGRLDPYGIAGLGMNLIKATPWADPGSYNFVEPKKSGFLYSIGFGANLFIVEHVGIYAEVAYGTNIVNGGLFVKF